ncbi:MarR family transcriptional regulator [Streptomyces sp. NBC_01716]|uniref:MarR family transcriptional regulator n=1 Tax=Streptomyces sp. NBC_01716 TaxID=2975917 RepID=UPI002E3535E2|nr:MarR family transcriptional regulator [Streptomyces sp. NBC_01716]
MPTKRQPTRGEQGTVSGQRERDESSHTHTLKATACFGLSAADQIGSALWRGVLGGELTQPQFLVLVAAHTRPGLGHHELAELAAIGRATVGPLVKKLVDAGMLERKKDPRDSRRSVLTALPRAIELLAATAEGADTVDFELMAPLSTAETAAVVQSWSLVAAASPPAESLSGASDPEPTEVSALDTRPWFHLRRARRAYRRIWHDVVSDSVSSSQFTLMTVIHDSPQIDIRTAARVASVEETTALRIVMRLARTRIVRDTRDTSDRRRSLLTLTDFGQELHATLWQRLAAAERTLQAQIPLQARSEFLRLTRKVARLA